jgi:hypothetical protein
MAGCVRGTAAVSGDNIVFTPAVNYFGDATITYKLNDGELDSKQKPLPSM